MKKIRWGTLIAYIILVIFAIITIFPFIYMILGGLMTFQETTKIPPTLIPKIRNGETLQKYLHRHHLLVTF